MPVVLAFHALAVLLGLFTVVWLVSLVRRDASLVDRFWGAGFVVVAGIALWFSGGWTAAGWPARLLVLLVTIWGLRLSVHLTARNWGRGEDFRYGAMRESHGLRFPWISLVTVFWLQAVLLLVVSAPLLAAARADVPVAGTGLVILGFVLWLIGFAFESIGDWQLAGFKADPANRGRVMDQGLWRYTRHPNYFGDALVWWGFFCFAAAQGAWWTIVGPLVMTGLLLKVSGMALLERSLAESKPGYRDYIRRTSAFIPRPPR